MAASGDLRNVIKTIVDLPDTFAQQIEMTINDRDFDVVARNAILLLLAFSAPGITSPTTTLSSIAETLIHLWYSVLIRASALSHVRSTVQPLISEVCRRIADKPRGVHLGKTWQFGQQRTLRLVLTKEE